MFTVSFLVGKLNIVLADEES